MDIVLEKIKSLFSFKDSDRSSKAKKNIVLLFIVHGFNFLSLLLIVPLSLNYLGTEDYGIWLTLSSILMWVGYLDLGIGNGLRVKLSEAFAKNNYEKGKIYTSTAYAVFTMGMAAFFILFLVVNNFLNWSVIFNTNPQKHDELSAIITWILALFLIQFLMRLLNSVINAAQRTALTGALTLAINFFTVIYLLLLSGTSPGSLSKLAIGSTIIPVVVFAAASLIFYKGFFKNIAPSVRHIDFNYSKVLFVLGGQFFVIQAAGLIVFATDNIIITQILGPSEVTVYNIAYRYFYFIPLLFNIILNSVLSAYTEAYTNGDILWIRNVTNKILKIGFLLTIVIIIMVLGSGIAYSLWVGDKVKIPFILTAAMGVFVIVSNWNNIFAYFINGVGKIRLQFYLSIIAAVFNIPLSIVFAKELGMGVTGVIIATTICLLPGSFLTPVQYHKIIKRKDNGIWGK